MPVESSSLQDSLRDDQRQRWSRGERVLVESYLQQHPDLSGNTAAILVLIESEFLLRRERGESPSIEEYSKRFPLLSGELSRRFARLSPHDATGSAPNFHGGSTLQTGARGRPAEATGETLSLSAKAGRRIAAFELIRRVGAGQHGEVWLAHDTRLRREVAVKLPRRSDDTRYTSDLFLREARAVARLRHPHIVQVHEAGVESGQPYIVSDYIRGTTLKERIAASPFAPREAARLCQQLAVALHHAHQAGIIHRDLKPGNVLLDEQGTPHIADFGLAKHLAIDELTVNAEGHLLGTPGYMPPEQARGEAGQAQPASDVYSLGVILYELLTGQRPFDGPLELLISRILTEEPVPPRKHRPQIARDLETICLKAIAKRPADRYGSAQEMAEDLDRFLRGEAIHARPASWIERAWRKLRRSPRLVAATATAVVLLSLFGSLWAAGMMQGLPSLFELPHPPDPDVHHLVEIVTEPEGASVVCYPVDYSTGRPIFERAIQGASKTPAQIDMPEGMYLIVAYTDDLNFHEVLRTVPRAPEIQGFTQRHERWTWDAKRQLVVLPPIKLFTHPLAAEGLVSIGGSDDFAVDLSPLGYKEKQYRVPPFEIQTTEVTVGDFQRFDSLSAVHGGRGKDLLAGKIRWGVAVAYAESRGMRLPDLVELEYLMAQSQHKYPWGDEEPRANNWDFDRPTHEATHDQLVGWPVITGLFSRGLEWTSTRSRVGRGADPGLRYAVRGPAKLLGDPHLVAEAGAWASVNEYVTHPGLGVRCASSPKPRLKAEDFIRPAPAP